MCDRSYELMNSVTTTALLSRRKSQQSSIIFDNIMTLRDDNNVAILYEIIKKSCFLFS